MSLNFYSKEQCEKHLKRLKSGAVLLAGESLEPPFKSTIILLCQYDKEEGALGVVCNYPSHMPLNEVFEDIDTYQNKKKTFYIGGPVEPDCVQILRLTNDPTEESIEIADGVYAGGHWDVFSDILSLDTDTTRIFLGYSGWSPGQLEEEIKEGAWEVYNANVSKLLTDWQEPLTFEHSEIKNYLQRSSSQD